MDKAYRSEALTRWLINLGIESLPKVTHSIPSSQTRPPASDISALPTECAFKAAVQVLAF
jgi:hypothetical protein